MWITCLGRYPQDVGVNANGITSVFEYDGAAEAGAPPEHGAAVMPCNAVG